MPDDSILRCLICRKYCARQWHQQWACFTRFYGIAMLKALFFTYYNILWYFHLSSSSYFVVVFCGISAFSFSFSLSLLHSAVGFFMIWFFFWLGTSFLYKYLCLSVRLLSRMRLFIFPFGFLFCCGIFCCRCRDCCCCCDGFSFISQILILFIQYTNIDTKHTLTHIWNIIYILSTSTSGQQRASSTRHSIYAMYQFVWYYGAFLLIYIYICVRCMFFVQ